MAIPHPLGDPDKLPDEEKGIRRRLVEKALEAVETDIAEQRIFE